MQITGRLTSDAKVKTLKDKRQVVTFSLAVNESFKAKDEKKDKTVFYQCSYWINPKAVTLLKKAAVVELTGYADINAYQSQNNEFNAFLTFHVNAFKLLHSYKSISNPAPVAAGSPDENPDDLPF